MSHKKVFLASFFVSLMLSTVIMLGGLIFDNTALTSVENKGLTVVIDPGHGGFDGGAVAKDGTMEKNINLAIAKELENIMKEYEVNVVMTRNEDKALDNGEDSIKSRKRADLEARKRVIEEANPDITISIHLNSYPTDASVCGAQVFYPADEQKRTNKKEHEQSSKEYAITVQKSLEINVSDGRERRAMAKDDILLFKDPDTPIILVECGFLSNADECDRLKTAEYQGLLAMSIWEGINTKLGAEKKQKIQVIHSTNKVT